MKNKNFLLIAIICGVIAAGGVFAFLIIMQEKFVSKHKKNTVFVATRDIFQNEQIYDTMFEVKQEIPYEGAITTPDEIINYYTIAPIKKGEQIVDTKLRQISITELATRIPPDKRAVTIGINEVTGVSGMIRPGNRVDILVTYYKPDGEKEITIKGEKIGVETMIWRENVEVLAVGEQTENEDGEGLEYKPNGTVTVALNPADAVQLPILQDNTEISLMLRSIWETGQTKFNSSFAFSPTNDKFSLINVLKCKIITIRDIRGKETKMIVDPN